MSSGDSSASVYLGLGSNVGNRPRNLKAGLRALREAGVEVRRASSLYLTEPVGDPDDPWYVNCVVALHEPPAADELLEACLAAERRAGRRPLPPGATRDPAASTPPRDPAASGAARSPAVSRPPRELDVDLLLYGELLRDDPELTVPHPRMHQRRFVLQPLAEIAPRARHPGRDRSVREMLADLAGLDEPGAREGVWLLAGPLPTGGRRPGADGGERPGERRESPHRTDR